MVAIYTGVLVLLLVCFAIGKHFWENVLSRRKARSH